MYKKSLLFAIILLIVLVVAQSNPIPSAAQSGPQLTVLRTITNEGYPVLDADWNPTQPIIAVAQANRLVIYDDNWNELAATEMRNLIYARWSYDGTYLSIVIRSGDSYDMYSEIWRLNADYSLSFEMTIDTGYALWLPTTAQLVAVDLVEYSDPATNAYMVGQQFSIWDVPTATQQASWIGPDYFSNVVPDPTGTRILVSYDDTMTGQGANRVEIYDLTGQTLASFASSAHWYQWSADGTLLVANDPHWIYYYWDASNNFAPLTPDISLDGFRLIWWFALGMVVITQDNEIQIYDVSRSANGVQLQQTRAYPNPTYPYANGVRWNHDPLDPQLLITSLSGQRTTIWDMTTDVTHELWRGGYVSQVQLSPDGAYLHTGGFVWATDPSQPDFGPIDLVARGVNGAWIPTGDYYASLRDGQGVVLVYDGQSLELLQEIALSSPIMSLSWSPDSTYLLLGDEGGIVTLLDTSTFEIVMEIPVSDAAIRSVEINSANTRIATSAPLRVNTVNERPELMFRSEDFVVQSWVPSGSHWSPNGDYLAAYTDTTLTVFDAATWQVVAMLATDESDQWPGGLRDIAWYDDQQITLAVNQTVLQFDITTQTTTTLATVEHAITDIEWSANRTALAAGDGTYRVTIWTVQ